MSSGTRSSMTGDSTSASFQLILLAALLTVRTSHTSHHLVAIYAMGAGGPLLEEVYKTHIVTLQPAFKSPEPITDDNFWKHLGQREYVGNS